MKQLLFSPLLLLGLAAQAQQLGTPRETLVKVSAPEPPSKHLLALDAANGVGKIHLGADRVTFSGLVQVAADGPVTIYTRKNDRLALGQVVVKEVRYYFYHDKLVTFRLNTPDEASSQAALQELVARYGEGYRPTQTLERYSWASNHVTLIYSKDMRGQYATIQFSSNALSEQWQREKAGTSN